MGKLPQLACQPLLKVHRWRLLLRNYVRTNSFSNSNQISTSAGSQQQQPPTRRSSCFTFTVPTTFSPHNATGTNFRRIMSSDADYAAFLDKANQGTAQTAQSSSKKSYGTKSVNTAVPKALEQVEEYYTSDADEPFEPVALKFDGSEVSADDLKSLIGGDKDVEEVSEKSFGSQYKAVVDAVRQAGSGSVKIFKVDLGRTRAEYYVVTVDKDEGRIVGLKALSVES